MKSNDTDFTKENYIVVVKGKYSPVKTMENYLDYYTKNHSLTGKQRHFLCGLFIGWGINAGTVGRTVQKYFKNHLTS